MRPAYRASAALAALLVGVGGLSGATALAAKVGVASAVNQDAFSGSGGTITIGKSIFYNERVRTSPSGLIQVLLVDGSAFTVGPNSDLVIDKFVYDPNKGKGEMVASFSKGVLRFVGGKLSKSAGGVSIKTPSGALAVRGGIMQAQVNGNRGRFSFVFGDEMVFVQNSGRMLRVFTSGYTIDGLAGFNNAFTRPTTPEDNAFFLTRLAGRPGTDGGSGGGPSNAQVEQGIGGANSNVFPPDITLLNIGNTELTTVDKADFTTDLIQAQVREQLDEQPDDSPPDDGPPDNPSPPPPPPPPPPPDDVEVRVLSNGAFYPSLFGDFGNGVLGGDPVATADDFVTSLTLDDGRLSGTVSGLTGSERVFDQESQEIVETLLPPIAIDLPFSTADGVTPIEDASITIGDADPETFIGSSFFNSGFFAYRLFGPQQVGAIASAQSSEVDPDRQLALFGGPAYQPINQPSGKLREFQLYSDPRENLAIPFASGFTAPQSLLNEDIDDFVMKPLNHEGVSKLLLLEKDSSDSEDRSRTVWMQSSFVLSGAGENQESGIVVALGGMQDGGLVGQRRGGSQILVSNGEGTSQESYSFTGGVATIAGPNGAHFLGKDNPNVVIGADTTGEASDPFVDLPLSAAEPGGTDAHATYHVASQINESLPATQNGGTFSGYAAGIVRSEVPANAFLNVAKNDNPDDFVLAFDPETNTLSARLDAEAVDDDIVESYNLRFGDDPESPDDRSAYITDRLYAGIEGTGSSVSQGGVEGEPQFEFVKVTGYIISHDAIDADRQLFPGQTVEVGGQDVQKTAFCQSCDFIKWGAWGARVNFGNDSASDTSDNIHLGWWIAGEVTDGMDLPVGGNATYNGDVVGSVFTGGKQYTATGDLTLAWNFGSRSGRIDVNDFDGRDFTTGSDGISAADRVNRFSGNWGGEGVEGGAVGSFIRTPTGAVDGVIGNFDYRESGYQATGIFGGVRQLSN